MRKKEKKLKAGKKKKKKAQKEKELILNIKFRLCPNHLIKNVFILAMELIVEFHKQVPF